MLRKILFAIGLLSVALLSACSKKQVPADVIRVGTIAGPETQLMEVAKKVAFTRYGLKVKIKTFSDYTIPNVALNDGSIDANIFQHLPFLKAQVKAHGYQIVSVGKTFVFPMALYSKKYKSIAAIPKDSSVAIPNDPSNEARALLLLQKAGLIQLRPDVGTTATVADVVNNPKNLKLLELDAAELPRALNDVALAAINTNFAIPAGLSPEKDALLHEDKRSPYANIIVVRDNEKGSKKVQELIKAYQSEDVRKKAQQLFGDGAIVAW